MSDKATRSEYAENLEFNLAKKVSLEEYEKQSGNMVFYEDGIYETVKDCIRSLLRNKEYDSFKKLKYVWGTIENRSVINADEIIEEFERPLCGYKLEGKGYTELTEFINRWNNEYGKRYYSVDYDTAILVPEEYKDMIANEERNSEVVLNRVVGNTEEY